MIGEAPDTELVDARRVATIRDAFAAVVPPGTRVQWDRHHGERHTCPNDGENLMRVAIVDLCYTFEVCTCGDPEYPHLVEQLWHRGCFRRMAPEVSS